MPCPVSKLPRLVGCLCKVSCGWGLISHAFSRTQAFAGFLGKVCTCCGPTATELPTQKVDATEVWRLGQGAGYSTGSRGLVHNLLHYSAHPSSIHQRMVFLLLLTSHYPLVGQIRLEGGHLMLTFTPMSSGTDLNFSGLLLA